MNIFLYKYLNIYRLATYSESSRQECVYVCVNFKATWGYYIAKTTIHSKTNNVDVSRYEQQCFTKNKRKTLRFNVRVFTSIFRMIILDVCFNLTSQLTYNVVIIFRFGDKKNGKYVLQANVFIFVSNNQYYTWTWNDEGSESFYI